MNVRNKQPEHVLIEDVIVKHVTLKAVLVADDKVREVWIPLSQVHGDPKVGDTDIYVTPWFANKNSLEY